MFAARFFSPSYWAARFWSQGAEAQDTTLVSRVLLTGSYVRVVAVSGSAVRQIAATASASRTVSLTGSSDGLGGQFDRREFDPAEFLTDGAVTLSGSAVTRVEVVGSL